MTVVGYVKYGGMYPDKAVLCAAFAFPRDQTFLEKSQTIFDWTLAVRPSEVSGSQVTQADSTLYNRKHSTEGLPSDKFTGLLIPFWSVVYMWVQLGLSHVITGRYS